MVRVGLISSVACRASRWEMQNYPDFRKGPIPQKGPFGKSGTDRTRQGIGQLPRPKTPNTAANKSIITSLRKFLTDVKIPLSIRF
jgi:hypothetical protein